MNFLQDQQNVIIIDQPFSAVDAIKTITKDNIQDEPFYVMDVGDLLRKYELWVAKLPSVKPFYAVKCNDSPMVLKVLASLGIGFDCASKGEMNKVLGLDGMSPERIIFANPTKMLSHLKFSAMVGIDLMTFDNVIELHKIKEHHPEAKLLLRLRCESTQSMYPLGKKFGCDEEICEELLQLAAELKLNVIGVCFHVGSGCSESKAYTRGICLARRVFDLAKTRGFSMSLLDIGGGFISEIFDEVADEINRSLDNYFSDMKDIQVIAEPGRYFVSNAFTLATTIHSKREIKGKPAMYYINDGVFGSLSGILYGDKPKIQPLETKGRGQPTSSYIWGPTCDSTDLISKDALLPPMDVGEILVFADLGAYSVSLASTFNGYPLTKVYHFIPAMYCQRLKEVLPSEVIKDTSICHTCKQTKNITYEYDYRRTENVN